MSCQLHLNIFYTFDMKARKFRLAIRKGLVCYDVCILVVGVIIFTQNASIGGWRSTPGIGRGEQAVFTILLLLK